MQPKYTRILIMIVISFVLADLLNLSNLNAVIEIFIVPILSFPIRWLIYTAGKDENIKKAIVPLQNSYCGLFRSFFYVPHDIAPASF